MKYGWLCAAAAALMISAATTKPVQAQQASIYNPPVDVDARGFKPAKFKKDLAMCRKRAAPHAHAARAAASEAEAGSQQAAAGSVISAAGSIMQALPIPGFTAARNVFAGGAVAGAVGDAVGAQGEAKRDQAAADANDSVEDYQLTIDSCLRRRGYTLIQ